MNVAVVDPDRCPDCGGTLESVTVDQPAIVRHGGYGATRRLTVRYCPDIFCGYHRHHETSEIRP